MPMQPAANLFVIMIILFVIGLVIFLAAYIKDAMFPKIIARFDSTNAEAILNTAGSVLTAADNMFFFVAIALGLGSVLLAFTTEAKPAFLFLAIFMFAIALVIIPSFANIFQDIAAKPQFSTDYGNYTANYTMTFAIFQNYPLFLWVFGFLILVVLFGKLRSGRGEV